MSELEIIFFRWIGSAEYRWDALKSPALHISETSDGTSRYVALHTTYYTLWTECIVCREAVLDTLTDCAIRSYHETSSFQLTVRRVYRWPFLSFIRNAPFWPSFYPGKNLISFSHSSTAGVIERPVLPKLPGFWTETRTISREKKQRQQWRRSSQEF